jgi:PAS domain S-box-containing protein
MKGEPLRILHQTLLGEALMSGRSAVLVTDDEGRYLAVNDSATELLGYSRDELVDLNAHDVSMSSEEEIADVYAMLSRTRSLQRTARLRRQDGVVGTIGYVALESVVAGLPVVVFVTGPIDTFAPETS